MIVILMSNSEVNNLALAKLKLEYNVTHSFIYPNCQRLDPDEVVLVDLNAEGKLQNTSKEELSNFLISNNLVQNQSFINLLASDVIKGNSIGVYGAALVNEIQKNGIYPIVSFIEDLNFQKVFVASISTTNENWKIYGINYNNEKKLLWEGSDIIGWCKENNTVEDVIEIPNNFNLSTAYRTF